MGLMGPRRINFFNFCGNDAFFHFFKEELRSFYTGNEKKRHVPSSRVRQIGHFRQKSKKSKPWIQYPESVESCLLYRFLCAYVPMLSFPLLFRFWYIINFLDLPCVIQQTVMFLTVVHFALSSSFRHCPNSSSDFALCIYSFRCFFDFWKLKVQKYFTTVTNAKDYTEIENRGFNQKEVTSLF